MRVLAVCVPSPGHVNPMLPLLTAMAAQGDEVVVATGPDAADALRAAGLRHAAAGDGFGSWFARLGDRIRGTPGAGLPPERIEHYFLPRLFAEIAADDMVAGVLAAGRELSPDVVVFETFAYAGPLVAAVQGVPAVQLQVGFRPAPEVTELVADALSPLWCDVGVPVDRRRSVSGTHLLRTAPETLEAADALVPSIALRPTAVPTAAPAPDDPPLVHVTFGTTSTSDPTALRTVLDALADADVTVVATAADAVAGDLAVAGNTTLARYVPHAELLPRCSVVVHHGGAGTMYAAMAHGLPQVVAPQAADQFDNARAVDRAGLGVALLPDHVSVDAVRDAVERALHDTGLRRRAASAAAEIEAMPDAASVAADLRARFLPAASGSS